MTRNHNGRPISVQWESTPAIYSAIFSDEYDGAPDSRNPVGYGKTEEEAVANLIENDEVFFQPPLKGEPQ
jgi:hypothetical protein